MCVNDEDDPFILPSSMDGVDIEFLDVEDGGEEDFDPREKYPFSRLKPRQGFFVPAAKKTKAELRRLSHLLGVLKLRKQKRFPGRKFAVRCGVFNGDRWGCVVWRIE